MNVFDFEILSYLNGFSQYSSAFDQFIGFISCNNLLKGGILIAIIWWVWFKSEDRQSYNREIIISTLFSCVVAMALARALALMLPFRLRPQYEGGLHFLIPSGIAPMVSDGWSSLPSDHAVLFFTLSTGLLLIQRKLGVFAFFYSIMFIAFPRVYLGLHYPTDIIAGAIIGIAIALIVNTYLVKNKHILSIVRLSYSKPSLFYSLFFLFTYQIADMFNDSRQLASEVFQLIGSIIG